MKESTRTKIYKPFSRAKVGVQVFILLSRVNSKRVVISVYRRPKAKPIKIFIYKSLLVFFLVLILFKLTIGSLINNYEKKINLALSKDNLVNIKNKLREEIKSGIKKERILNH